MNSNEIDKLLDEIYDINKKYVSASLDQTNENFLEERYAYEMHKRRRSLSPDLPDLERDRRTVFVRQLAQKITTPILEEFFEKAGPVRQVKMVMDKVTRRPKGFAFIEFRKPESVQIAISFTGQKILGVPVIVELTETEKNRIDSIGAPAPQKIVRQPVQDIPKYNRVRVNNLHPSIDEYSLKKLFDPFGLIESVNVGRNDHGQTTGIGVIRYYYLLF